MKSAATGHSTASLSGVYYTAEFNVNPNGRSSALATLTFHGDGTANSAIEFSDETGGNQSTSASGTYDVLPDGTFLFVDGTAKTTGHLSADGNTFIAARTDSTTVHNLSVGIKRGAGSYSNASLHGTYYGTSFNGTPSTYESSIETYTFDGAGHVLIEQTYSDKNGGNKPRTIVAEYVVNNDGAFAIAAGHRPVKGHLSADSKTFVFARLDDSAVHTVGIGTKWTDAVSSSYPALPGINHFQTSQSDRFLVDLETINDGHPFRGGRATSPHNGAHVHWDNTSNTWPVGGSGPSNYPAIYAVADGYVDRVDYRAPVLANDRYGIAIAVAAEGSTTYLFDYNIEPMIPEPTANFYRSYILVTPGQVVHKGDVIGYMYLAPGAGIGSHIHFHVQRTSDGAFMAPALFTDTLRDAFHSKWSIWADDGGTMLPACMGYMLNAVENPFGTGPVDQL